MISRISGLVVHHSERFVVLDVAGVGYKIFVTEETLRTLLKNPTEEKSLWTHLAVREDAMDLYGFLNQEGLTFFEMLISVSGIGPKTALGVLNLANVSDLEKAVATGETERLIKVFGVGKKIAEKIVLELRGKIAPGKDESGTGTREDMDALEALKALGYSQSESREALKKIPKEISGTSNRVKHALKNLSGTD